MFTNNPIVINAFLLTPLPILLLSRCSMYFHNYCYFPVIINPRDYSLSHTTITISWCRPGGGRRRRKSSYCSSSFFFSSFSVKILQCPFEGVDPQTQATRSSQEKVVYSKRSRKIKKALPWQVKVIMLKNYS